MVKRLQLCRLIQVYFLIHFRITQKAIMNQLKEEEMKAHFTNQMIQNLLKKK